MSLPTTIALIGANATAKAVTAQYLSEAYGYKHLPLQAPVRLLVEKLLLAYGHDSESVNYHLCHAPNEPLSRLPGEPTTRYLLQTLASDWGRSIVHRDIWLCAWQHLASDYPGVVVDDACSTAAVNMLQKRPRSVVWALGAPEPECSVDAVLPEPWGDARNLRREIARLLEED